MTAETLAKTLPIPHVADNTAVEAVERLIRHACDLGATDLHFDPVEDCVQVHVRWNGTLMPLETLPLSMAAHLVGCVKTLAQLQLYRRDVPQEGWIPSGLAGAPVDVRAAIFPTISGERIALRFSAPREQALHLDELGLPADVHQALVEACAATDGVVLMAGPSGCGKTTTLYACLRHLASGPDLRTLITIEDPVECRIPRVTQSQVNRFAGFTFATALRSVLRQDPDVILVGEIRDRETASVALEAGLTGHFVASTVHAGTAPQVFTRLLELDVEPFVLTSAVRGVVAQRLLRRCCWEPECGRRGVICLRCKGMGYVGSVLIAEWLPMSEALRQTILARGDGQAMAAAARATTGFRSLLSRAQELLRQGIISDDELARVFGPTAARAPG